MTVESGARPGVGAVLPVTDNLPYHVKGVP